MVGERQLGVRDRICTREQRAWDSLPRAVLELKEFIWTTLSDVGFEFWVGLCGARVGLGDPCGFLPIQNVL